MTNVVTECKNVVCGFNEMSFALYVWSYERQMEVGKGRGSQFQGDIDS